MDVDELNQLMAHATRQRIKVMLSLETRKLETEMIKLREQQSANESAVKNSSCIQNQNRCYDVKLTNYGKIILQNIAVKSSGTLPFNSPTYDENLRLRKIIKCFILLSYFLITT